MFVIKKKLQKEKMVERGLEPRTLGLLKSINYNRKTKQNKGKQIYSYSLENKK